MFPTGKKLRFMTMSQTIANRYIWGQGEKNVGETKSLGPPTVFKNRVG